MYIKLICLFLLFNYAQSASVDLSCEDIAGFVMGHNLGRYLLTTGKVENLPAASEMNMMVWDEDLAAKAGELMSTYPDKLDADQSTSGGLPIHFASAIAYVNKNVQIQTIALQSKIFEDCSNYTYGPFAENLADPSHSFVAHCTQIIWSNSIYLGCAMSKDIEGDLKKIHVICAYGPSGNILGQEPYKSGPPSNTLICAANEHRCEHPYGDMCSIDNKIPYVRG